MQAPRVLVIGPRRGLLDALRMRRTPFAVWRERDSYAIPDATEVLVAPLWSSNDKLRQTVRAGFGQARYTHVIAGTDAAVYPAAVARRELGARQSPVTTALRCRDKLAMKQYLAGHDIPMTDFLPESYAHTPAEIFARLGTPVVRKRRKSSGGRGLELLHNPDQLVRRQDGRNILERYIDAPEASIESFIQGGRIRFTNTTRYLEKRHVNFVPSGFDQRLQAAMLDLNRRVIEALRIEWGMTHLEVYLCSTGLLFGEIALRPPGGYIMNAMLYAYAFNPWSALLAMELGEEFDFPAHISSYASVDLFHPGAGVVAGIRGEEQLRSHPATREFRLKIRPGDTISTRESSGQDVGYVLHASPSAEERQVIHDMFETSFAIDLQ